MEIKSGLDPATTVQVEKMNISIFLAVYDSSDQGNVYLTPDEARLVALELLRAAEEATGADGLPMHTR